MRKLAPKGFDVSLLTCSSSRVTFSGGNPPTESIPNAPALETAAASSGFARAAIPACCMGTLQPISLVNLVSSIMDCLESGELLGFKLRDGWMISCGVRGSSTRVDGLVGELEV